MGIKCHLNISPSKECYEVCVQSRWCGALKMWESEVKQMTKFEKQLHDMFDHIWDCEIDHPVYQDTVGDLMSAVIQAQPEIIRCKDCKHLPKFKINNNFYCLNENGLHGCVQLDDFCSYGERGEADDN